MKKRVGNTIINEWKLYYEKYGKDEKQRTRSIIRRWEVTDGKGTNRRYPPKKFQSIRTNHEELERLVQRLNATEFKEEIAKAKAAVRTAFVNFEDEQAYERHLRTRIPSPEGVARELSNLKAYVISYFVGKLGLKNPKDWYSKRQDFMEFVLSEDTPASVFSKKFIVQCVNRFMRWLHEERPNEVPQVVFPQPSKAMLMRIRRSTEGRAKKRGIIPDSDWQKITKAMNASPIKTDTGQKAAKAERAFSDIRPWVLLSYHYGLRRAEALGLAYEGTDAVYEDCLVVRKALEGYDCITGKCTFGLLKTPGRLSENGDAVEKREIPHWLGVDANETADWIEAGLKNLMHPDTLSHRWEELMEKLDMKYHFHELRHTWITKARAEHKDREVQLAAGHASIVTTEKYSHDHRKFERKHVRPKAG